MAQHLGGSQNRCHGVGLGAVKQLLGEIVWRFSNLVTRMFWKEMLQEFNYLSTGAIRWNIFFKVSHPKCGDRINLKGRNIMCFHWMVQHPTWIIDHRSNKAERQKKGTPSQKKWYVLVTFPFSIRWEKQQHFWSPSWSCDVNRLIRVAALACRSSLRG